MMVMKEEINQKDTLSSQDWLVYSWKEEEEVCKEITREYHRLNVVVMDNFRYYDRTVIFEPESQNSDPVQLIDYLVKCTPDRKFF